MAGIGWKLQRMIDRGSLAGTIGAYLTGVAVTSAPWLLTTAVLTSLRIAARHAGADFGRVEALLTVVYAVTVVLSAPVHVVVSRTTADRLYDHHLEAIGAPLRRAVALTVAGFGVVGIGIVLLMRLPLALALVGAPPTERYSHSAPMTAVSGAPGSLLGALLLARFTPSPAVGYLYGFAAGQLATLALLVRGVARAVPGPADERARLLPAFSEYRLLALSALAFYVSIWADKVVVYLVQGGAAAAFYAAIAAVAWFSVIPAFAWIYVQVETVFYQRFRAFYADLESGAPLRQLKQGAELISDEARRILRGAAIVQAAATAVAIAAAPVVMRLVGLSPNATPLFRLAAIGAAMQVITLLVVLLLYYFDLRRDALIISTALLGGEAVLTLACIGLRWPPVIGYLVACAATAMLGVMLVRRRLGTLVLDTFQSQPFGVS